MDNSLIALLFAVFNINYVIAFRVFNVNGAVTMLALEKEAISIQCQQEIAMAYCVFVHPSGKRYSFSGNELNDGHCAIRINATHHDSGEWKCHIGRKQIGVELMQKIQLRVVDKVAAVHSNITSIHGKDVTIECVTTEGYLPLSYCRFEPPDDAPFSIDSAVNHSSPILGRYYFPQNKSLDRGDCAVTIRKVKYEDVGLWTCGAGLSDGQEYTDSVKLVVKGLYTMSSAAATGVTIGALAVAAVFILLGYIGWTRKAVLGVARQPEAEGNEMVEMPPARSPTGSRRLSVSRRSPPTGRSSSQASRVPTLTVQPPSEPESSS